MTDNFYDLTNPNFLGIMWRFLVNIVFLFILIRLIYFRFSRKDKFLFSFFLMGIMAFFITSMFRSVFIEMGMAVGLFAIFGILRLKASNFSVKDMAYTFATFGLSVINSLKLLKFPLLGVLVINIIIVLSAYLLERYLQRYRLETYSIIYEKLDMLKPDKKDKLLKDISERTGENVVKVKINRINYKRKTALLDIYYHE
jgi:Domain of unknown function (DUF4956)